MSLGEFIKQSALPLHSYGPWQEHVLGWLQAKLQHKLIIRYEDMLENPVACLKKTLNFAEVQVDDATLKDAVNRAFFGALKKLEQEKGFNYKGVNNVEFVRKGVAGGWAEHFCPEDMALFDRYHGGPIAELGCEW
jgi:aryl sulfotransferase